jgi:hypothetical protein
MNKKVHLQTTILLCTKVRENTLFNSERRQAALMETISCADCSPSRHSSGRRVWLERFLEVDDCWAGSLANQQKESQGIRIRD